MMTNPLWLYLSIFGWLFFTGIGLPPIPEEAGILYAAGMNALHEEVWWPLAWFACSAGIVCADLVLYGIGRKWGVRLFDYRWVQKFLKKERRERLEGRFHQHGIKLLILARFLPPLRTGVFLIAGAAKYSIVKFLVADLVYAVFGVGLFFLGGAWIIGLFDKLKHLVGHWAVWLLLVPVLGYAAYRYFKYLKAREGATSPQPPVSVLDPVEGKVPEGVAATQPAAAPAALAEAKEMLK